MANNPQWNELHRRLLMPEPTTAEAKAWAGWGTALKPAHEPIVLARKRVGERSVAANVLKHGTGGLNIEACRVGTDVLPGQRSGVSQMFTGLDGVGPDAVTPDRNGRWPPNILLTHSPACGETCESGCPVRVMDEQSGESRTPETVTRGISGRVERLVLPSGQREADVPSYGDTGGASRFLPIFRWEPSEFDFLYCAKPSSSERDQGCDALPAATPDELTGRKAGSAGLVMQHTDGSAKANPYAGTSGASPRRNVHPTVKPVALMGWLARLLTPPSGLVLDPFAGSGTTILGAMREGFDVVAFELDPVYAATARARADADIRGGLFERLARDADASPPRGEKQGGLFA
jgi:site-specific DNA-methyltransferase (adenine-specific)